VRSRIGELEQHVAVTVGFILVAGRHRLEAVRKLNKTDPKSFPDAIRAEIREGLDADTALLAEIDENLIFTPT